MFKRPGNLKGSTGFMKQTELYPFKCRSKSPTWSIFTFNLPSNLNVQVFTIFFSTVVFVLTTRRAPANRISWLFRWTRSRKKAISTYHCWQLHTVVFFSFLCVWRVIVELTKNNSCHSQLSYNLKRNFVKWHTLTGKETERNTRKKVNLSSDNVYFFFASFLLFHQTFGLN